MLNKDKIYISPSIIASDLSLMGQEVTSFDRSSVDILHIDVMDGHFVPSMTFGPGYIKSLSEHTDIPLDIHLMIEKPEDSLDQYIAINPWSITIHYESTRFPARLLSMIKEKGIKSGIALNPATPVENIYDITPYLDLILIMSVDPGFSGQSFMGSSISRIKKISTFLQQNSLDSTIIAVDGGINRENIATVVNAGARLIVAGSSAFKNGKVNENTSELKKYALSAF